MTSHFPEVMGVAFPLRKCFNEYNTATNTDAVCTIFNTNTYVLHIMNMLVSLGVTHHLVETEFILSKEKR